MTFKTLNYVAAVWTVFLFTLVLCPHSFGQAEDCDQAASRCRQNCAEKKVTERTGWAVMGSDFQEKCNKACATRWEACHTQDSENSCNTFSNHCQSDCPWTVFNSNLDEETSTSDSFKQWWTPAREGGSFATISSRP